MTAQQVHSLTKKQVEVIPTKTIPQGIAALLAFDYEADFDTNIKLMEAASAAVKTIEITRSVRQTKINGMKIKRKQPIGLLDDVLVAVADTPIEVLNQVLKKVDLDKVEIITIYYGADTQAEDAEDLSTGIRERFQGIQIDVVQGGQPHYDFIVSVE